MPVPLRVMIVEDSEDDALLLLRELRRGGYAPGFERIETPEAMRAALDREPWDIILADYSLPHFSAPEALALVRERKLDLPFIVVSGRIGEETAVVLMRAGAHDYLMKDNLARLVPAVKRELRDAEVRRERERTEAALEEERRKAQRYLDIAGVILVAIDTDHRVTLINRKGREILGYPAEEIVGRTWFDTFLPERERDRVRACFARLAAGEREGVEHFENPVLTREGEERLIAWHNAPLRDETNRIVGTLSSGEDITERRRAEEALRGAEEEKTVILSSLSEYVTYQDGELRMRWANRAATEAIGVAPERLVGRHCYEVWHRRDKPCEACPVRKALQTGRAEEGELASPEGRVFSLRGYPVRGENGQIVGVVEVTLDITERKQAERALQHRVALERLVSSISTRFISLPAEEMDTGIHYALKAIGEFARVDRSYVFRYSEDGKTMSNTHEWCGEGIEPQIGKLQGLVADPMPSTIQGLKRGEVVRIPRVADLPPEASADREFLEAQDIRSLVLVPMACEGRPLGYLGLDSVRAEATWSDADVALLKTVGDVFVGALQRRKAKETLRSTNERLGAIIQASPLAIFAIDGDGTVTMWSAAAERIFGWSAREALGLRLPIVPEDKQDEFDALRARVMRGEAFTGVEARRQRKDGSPIEVSISGAPLRDPQDVIVGAMGVVADITERKRAEELVLAQRDLALDLAAASTLDEALSRCLDTAIRVSGMDCGGIYLVDGASGDLNLACVKGLSSEFVEAESHVPAGSDQASLVTAGKKPIYTRVGDIHIANPGPLLKEGLRGLAVIPVVHQGRVIACFNLASHTLDAVPAASRYALETIAAQVGNAIAQMQAEEALRESEERYRVFVQNFQGIAYRGTMDFKPLFFHGAVEAITGFTPEDFVAGELTWDQVIHPDDVPRIRKSVESLRSVPGYSADREYRILRKDGQIRWIHELIQNLTDSSGKPVQVQGSLYDITERKRAEEALRVARERLHHLLTASSAVVYSCEPSGSYSTTFISENVKDLLGYEARQFTEDPGFWAKNIHPEDAPGVFARLPRILELGHHQHEYRFRHQDGTYRWMHDAMRLVRDAAGRPVEIVGTWVDITDRKRAEEALRASEAKYRSLVEHLPAITYVAALDEASTTLYVSPQIEAMIGFSPAEYAANPDTWRQRLHPDDRERVMAELLRSRARGAPLSAEYRMIARDGRVVWFRDEATLVRDPAGKPLFLRGVMVDITERKQLQDELLRVTEAERQRFGRELHDGLGQQLVGMSFLSDALANRLAAKSLPEAADARAIAEVAREGIEMARSAARGLCPVVGGGSGLASALGELASNTQRACQASCTFERGRSVSLQDDATAGHLYRIAQEAVTNALKHAKGDAIHISLATRKGRLTLTVTDNGVGVSDEALVATKGMGLRAMRHRAELIGATLDVRRGARGGTAVTCTLPASAPEDHPGTGPRAELP